MKAKAKKDAAAPSIDQQLQEILAWFKKRGTKKGGDSLARFAIVAPKAFGVSITTMRPLVKMTPRNHELALALWDSEWHDARMLAVFLDEPERVTPAQMDAWAKRFNNWADCDAACFQLFDKTPHAFAKVKQWAKRREEFVKRGAFALLASLALHDRKSEDAKFLACLPLIEAASDDDRNFVKKGVNWALRAVGERNSKLNKPSVALAERLAKSDVAAARWIGKDALRQLKSPAAIKRLAMRDKRFAKG